MEDRLEVEETKRADDRDGPPHHTLVSVDAPEQEDVSGSSAIEDTLHLNFIAVLSFRDVRPVTFYMCLV